MIQDMDKIYYVLQINTHLVMSLDKKKYTVSLENYNISEFEIFLHKYIKYVQNDDLICISIQKLHQGTKNTNLWYYIYKT
jgi:hypothetical protein